MTKNTLSQTFESDVLFSPRDYHRITVSPEKYARYRQQQSSSRTTWGRRETYGGMGVVEVNNEPYKNNVQKGTHHYGSGTCPIPRSVLVQEQYDVTNLKRNEVRQTDELIESPNKMDLSKHQIELTFPANHPYHSHIPSKDLFPSNNPIDRENPGNCLEATHPASAPALTVLEKARGNGKRHDRLTIPLNSKRQPMAWPEGPTYFQLLEGPHREHQLYYPTPSNCMLPNPSDSVLSAATRSALKEIQASQWTTTYQRAYGYKLNENKNLDTKETLLEITALPNAQVPSSMLEQNGSDKKETVEEITGNSENKRRMVQFEDVCNGAITEVNKFDQCPSTSPNLNYADKFSNIHGKTGSYLDRRIDINSIQQQWSKSDMQNNFNIKYGDLVPDLRRTPDRRITTCERRHWIPEAGNMGSFVFNGQYAS